MRSSNACINHWFNGSVATPAVLQAKSDAEKTLPGLRLAYQIPELAGRPCGRSLEDSLILANPDLFTLAQTKQHEWESLAFESAKEKGKTEFAIHHAIKVTSWTVPRYIADGLKWLAEQPLTALIPSIVPTPQKKVKNGKTRKPGNASGQSGTAKG